MKKNDKNSGFIKKSKYLFDSIMSKGTVSMVMLLFSITAAVVIVSGIIAAIFSQSKVESIGKGIWISLMHAIDAGTITADSGNLIYMILMTVVTVCGLFITSVLIGIINTGMERKISSLQKGKSCVIEQEHIIILGFNTNAFTIIRELILSNENLKKGVIVIMDNNMEKEEMESAVRQRVKDRKNTKIICRCGSITDIDDIEICSPETAKSIIINSEDDFITIKSILAVNSILKSSNNENAYINAVIKDNENYEAAVIAGENRAEILFINDTIAQIVANASRHAGLSNVYSELFAFSGNEIYVENIKGTAGKTFGEINRYFPESTIIGIKRSDQIKILPPSDEKIRNNDKLILIAENDGCSFLSDKPAEIDNKLILNNKNNSLLIKQKMLVFGYSPNLGKILKIQDSYLAKGSEILVAMQEEYQNLSEELIKSDYKNIDVKIYTGDIYHKSTVNKLLSYNPDSILVLSSQEKDAQEDDSKTLLLLLQIKATENERNISYPVTSEMRETENQQIAQVTEVKYFIISSNILSHMITQISQTRELNSIFAELLSQYGSEIYMKPATDYIIPGIPVDMYTAGAASALKNQVFIGYRLKDEKTGEFKVKINPPKKEFISFKTDDRFIVISEN